MRRIFWGFCRNWFLIDPLHFEPFRFWLRIRGDIRNRKTTPRLGKPGSRRLSDSPTRQVEESAVACLKQNSAIRRVGDSQTRRVGKSLTPRLAMVSRGVAIQIFLV